MFGSIASWAGNDIVNYGKYRGTKKTKQGVSNAEDRYSKNMKEVINDFMSSWTGTMPDGYESSSEYFFGGEKTLNLKDELSSKDRKIFQGLGSLEEQNAFLTDRLGYPVSLSEQYTKGAKDEYGGKVRMKSLESTVTPGATAEYGTFDALDEIRKKGGTPSIEDQYAPYIQTGNKAYEQLSNAILNGDFSDFYASPDYQFRLSEQEKEIDRLSAAGKIPTSTANKALIERSGNLAAGEYGNWLNSLSNLSNFGYNALSDLKSLESWYKGSEASMKSSMLNTKLGLQIGQSQLAGQETAQLYATVGNSLTNFGNAMTGTGNKTEEKTEKETERKTESKTETPSSYNYMSR